MNTPQDAAAALKDLRGFMSRSQLAAVQHGLRGEDQQFFIDKMVELASVVFFMPSTGETDGQGDKAVAYLRYFAGGRAQFFITEKDKGCPDDAPEDFQSQAFGLADLYGDGGEIGYISIAEIIANGGELDFYYTPKTLADIRHENDNAH